MRPITSLPQVIYRSPGDDLAPVLQERLQHLLQVEKFWLPFVQCHHVDAENTL